MALECLNYMNVKWDHAGKLPNNPSSRVNGFNVSVSLNYHQLSPHQ